MTRSQRDAWNFIVEFRKTQGRSPTIREIGDATGSGPGATHRTIEILIKDGHLLRFNRDIEMPTCYIPVVHLPREA